ncbi:hypothetical protein LOZ53_001048 [Ophidiomyces ophidiicola]|nr:hypothetical protein LOZ55_004167 [Ophidiomyces ophidiicola]KAI1994815.1 hypothetical protein LOZ54_000868 [Ophidiomyces ophidiicola]KAI1996447.1 hypothetical protein LOZ53_001048 [Ophidiomyces ophidiicola]KAI2001047.1 hypothetical protein LOZ51_001338 [Ophidiomyces ophidiicola]
MAQVPDSSGRPVRSTRRVILGYNEDFLEEAPMRSLAQPPRAGRPRRRCTNDAPRSLPASQQGPSPSSCSDTKKRFSQRSVGRPRQKKPRLELDIDKTGPQWNTLPYHILCDIFLYLSPSMKSHPQADTSQSVKCLLELSYMCRAFFEPAISALYFSPPLYPLTKVSGFLELLKKDQGSLYINYRDKVKQLELDAYRTKLKLIYSLLKYTPRLKYLRLYDLSEYNRIGKPARHIPWRLFCDMPQPEQLLQLRLHSWEWNGDMNFPSIEEVHKHPAFFSLRSVRFFQLEHRYSGRPDNRPKDVDYSNPNQQAQVVLSALTLLPHLEKLEFKKCNFAGNLLPLLPMNLQSLSLINCYTLTSSFLVEYLSGHGQHLRELILLRNPHLNMSFINRLGELCGRLQTFSMDFNVSPSTQRRTQFVESYFDCLLPNHECPSWPTTLQVIDLQRLNKWDVPAAEIFFNSLIEAAPRLRDLRDLTITATIKIDWRDRAKFREQWMNRLERIFLRRCAPPTRTVLESKPAILSSQVEVESSRKPNLTLEGAPMRRSNRIAQQVAPVAKIQSAEARTKMCPSESDEDQQEERIQGMCNNVKIRIDGLRPCAFLTDAENLSGEDSFDSDWNGVDIEWDTTCAW